MEKIKHEKLISKIVCVALAIILWLFVLYQENPTATKTVRDVPLVVTGEQILEENGFSVYSVSKKSVDVSVTAKRLNLPLFSKKTLSSGVNVSSIRKSGTYTLPATASSTADTNASYHVKNKDIIVVIERIEKATYKIETDISAPDDDSLILVSNELSREKVTVTAPKSVIKNVAYVKTEPITPKKNKSGHTAKLLAYDKDGNVINDASCSPEEVKVSYTLHSTKTVPVILATTSGEKISLSSEYDVTIQGVGENFDDIETLETEKVSLSKHASGDSITVKITLPKDVKIVGNSNEIEITLKEEYFK